MKPIVKLSFLAALAGAFTLSSCDGNSGGGEDDILLGKYADVAVKYEILDADSEYRSMEFTESGYAIIEEISDHVLAAPVKSYAPYASTYKMYTYTRSKDLYDVNGFGKVKYENGNLTIDGGDPISVKKDNSTAPSTLSRLYKSWTVKRTIISVKGGKFGSTGIGKTFTGFSPKAITEYIKENGVTVPEGVSEYVVKDITFTAAKTFAINFSAPSKAEPYVGTWNISGTSFSYDLGDLFGDSVINSEANGTIDLAKDGKTCTVVIKGKFTAGGSDYTTEIELELTAA